MLFNFAILKCSFFCFRAIIRFTRWSRSRGRTEDEEADLVSGPEMESFSRKLSPRFHNPNFANSQPQVRTEVQILQK